MEKNKYLFAKKVIQDYVEKLHQEFKDVCNKIDELKYDSDFYERGKLIGRMNEITKIMSDLCDINSDLFHAHLEEDARTLFGLLKEEKEDEQQA